MSTQPPRRLYWPAALFWVSGTATGITFYVSIATWSWRGFVLAGAGTLALLIALMVAVWFYGRDA